MGDIDWAKAGKELGGALFDELKEEIGIAEEARAELDEVGAKVARYATDTAAGVENAERLLRHARAELHFVVAEHSIDASRGWKAKAERILARVARIALALAKAAM